MTIRIIAALGAVSLAAAPLAAQDTTAAPTKTFTAAEEARHMALGRKVNTWFFEGQADSLLAIADSTTRERMGGIEGVRRQMDMVGERAGIPLNVLVEKMTHRRGIPQFWWEAEFSSFTQEPIVIRWLFNEQGEMVGAGMGPKSQAPPPDGEG